MNRILIIVVASAWVTILSACGHVSRGGWQPATEGIQEPLKNVISVPMVSRELVMDEVADEVDDYFRILREQRIRLTDNILTEGWIDTEPRIGSTVLEPWRKDFQPRVRIGARLTANGPTLGTCSCYPQRQSVSDRRQGLQGTGRSTGAGGLDSQWTPVSPR